MQLQTEVYFYFDNIVSIMENRIFIYLSSGFIEGPVHHVEILIFQNVCIGHCGYDLHYKMVLFHFIER